MYRHLSNKLYDHLSIPFGMLQDYFECFDWRTVIDRLSIPFGMLQYTIIIPNVKKIVFQSLLGCFIYEGDLRITLTGDVFQSLLGCFIWRSGWYSYFHYYLSIPFGMLLGVSISLFVAILAPFNPFWDASKTKSVARGKNTLCFQSLLGCFQVNLSILKHI